MPRPWFLIMRPLKIVIPPRAAHFSTLRLLASLQRRNPRFALKQSFLRALRCGGRGPRKISNARFRDPISKLRKGLIIKNRPGCILYRRRGNCNLKNGHALLVCRLHPSIIRFSSPSDLSRRQPIRPVHPKHASTGPSKTLALHSAPRGKGTPFLKQLEILTKRG
jgi:hypothetical protein